MIAKQPRKRWEIWDSFTLQHVYHTLWNLGDLFWKTTTSTLEIDSYIHNSQHLKTKLGNLDIFFSFYRGDCLWNMRADFEDVSQDACRSLVILSECFSILARWRGDRRCGRELSSGSQSAGKLPGVLGRTWSVPEMQCFVLLCAHSAEKTHTYTHSSSPFFVFHHSYNGHMCAMGKTCSPSPSLSVHPFKWAVHGSGSHSLWVSIWFLWDYSPVHLIMNRLFLSFWNIKAHAEWNRLKLMKMIWSFVTDGWQATIKAASHWPRRAVVMQAEHFY